MQEQELKLRENITLTGAEESTSSDLALTAFPNLGERFEVLSVIGSGGMSVVYQARERNSGQLYAVKVLKKGLLSDETAKQRFEQEAEIVRQLDHTNIIKVHGHAVTEDGTPYLVMEWIDGVTLAEQIKRHGPMPTQQAIAIFDQMTAALEYAHAKGIVHRDIKPSNILLVKSGDTYGVKIMDFGIAKILGADVQEAEGFKTQTGAVIGSPAYMSPEQCLGEDVNATSDIYSLGCVMYETLTAKNPFIASTPVGTILKHLESEPNPLCSDEFAQLKIPESLEQTVLKCLSKKPELRFPNAFAVRQSLFPQAGPVMRLMATVIDWGLVLLLLKLIKGPLFLTFQHTEFIDLFRIIDWADWALIFLTYVFYFTGFESSRLRATPGKLCTGLQVTNLNGGKASVGASLARAITTCAAASWLLYLAGTSQWAEDIDRSTGSYFGILSTIGSWSWFFFILYMLYAWVFVFCRKEQWHLDSLLDRRIITRKAAVISPRAMTVKQVTVPSLAVSLLGLTVLIGAPSYEQWLFEYAWGNPAIPKDRIVVAATTIDQGEKITREDLRYQPVLRDSSFNGGCSNIYNADSVVGKTLRITVYQGGNLEPLDLTDWQISDQGAAYWANKGWHAESRNDLDTAQLNYLKAVQKNPKDGQSWLRLAGIYQQRGSFRAAEAARAKADDCPPVSPAQLFREIDLDQQLESEEALASAKEALAAAKYTLARNPADADNLKLIVNALHTLNADATAEKYCDKAIALNPNDASLYVSRADAYDGLKQFDKAINDLDKAIALDPNNADLYNERAWTLCLSGRNKEAIADVSKSLRMNPTPEAYDTLGYANFKAGNNDAALKAYDKAIALDSTDGTYFFHRSLANARLGNAVLAESDKAQAKKLGYKPTSE